MPEQADRWHEWWETDEGSADEARAFDKIISRNNQFAMSSEIQTLHRPFLAWLEKLRGQVAWTYHRPDRATGATLGDADFVLYCQPGRCLHIEMKAKDTRVSASQKKRHAELLQCGILVHICRDLDTAIRLVLAWRGMSADTKPSRSEVPTHNLRVRGNGVFEYRDGALHHVRVATNDDKLRLTQL